jgi:DNA-binding GntR family transcriptional regulator
MNYIRKHQKNINNTEIIKSVSRMEKKSKAKLKLTSEKIYHTLKAKLISLELKPGQFLSDQEVASQLKVSRTPVRHAFGMLEKDGLLEIIPRKGAFIKFLSLKDILEIFQVRIALEGMAARLAAENVDLEALNKFESLYLNALQENSADNLQKIFNLGIKFHDFIIKNSGNQRTERILKDFRVQFEISRIFFLNQNNNIRPSRAIQSIKEHLGIIEALKQRDGSLAEVRMKEHISNAQKYTLSLQEMLVKGGDEGTS